MNNKITGKILLELKRNMPDYVSGEALSDLLEVSRTAIWKHIKELKEAGYQLESSSRKGYRLIEHGDVLNEYEICNDFNTVILGKNLVYREVVDSTNNYAKLLASEGCADGTVVVADIQTSGRGRLGRQWNSAPGKGIWMSIVLRPGIQPEDVQIMTLAASVAVTSSIRSLYGMDAGIKWPNDILLDGKKVCGILTEMNAEIERVNYMVLGIGINVNHQDGDFPEDIRKVATSLRINGGGKHAGALNRSKIIKAVLEELEKIYLNISDNYAETLEEIIRQWKRYSVTLGKTVRITAKGTEYTGMAVDIKDDGKLVVDCDDGIRREVLSGEVSVRGVLGYS